MDKNTRTFLILCISLVFIVFGVYTYNNKRYKEQSTMVVVPVEDTLNSNTEYIIYEQQNKNDYIQITSTETTDVNIDNTTKEIVPTTSKTTTTKSTTSKVTDTSISFPISLNIITYDELLCISGIGPSTAQKIIDYRNSIGGYFISRYQLLDINGIGQSKMNTILQYTYIENENLDYNNQDNSNNMDSQDNSIVEDNAQGEVVYEENPQTVVEYPINLNTATLEELCLIPNVDETIAQEIVSLRDTIQYFSDPYELLYTDSISEKFLSEIIDYISVE